MAARLSVDRYARAVEFLTTHARPLERALYRYYFEDAPAENALTALAAFQNDDGGFGHALEPDIRLPDSSVIATTIAFQHFRELCPPANHPMVTRACAYLQATYDADHAIWWIIPPNVDDAPHAPWWTYHNEPSRYLINPRAEIAGYLHDYAKLFSEDLRESVTEAVIAHLHTLDDIEMHDLLCYLRLYDTPTLPDDARQRMTDPLHELVRETVAQDPAQWSSYALQPLDVAPAPESPFAQIFGDVLEQNLNALIARQNEDGTWSPPWSWGEMYPETWPQAKQDWTGVLTLKNLRILRDYNRLG